MELPKWTEPALCGAGVGAIALAIIGFNWGGWVTGGTAAEMDEKSSRSAVAEALTPYCLALSVSDPSSIDIMKKLNDATSYKKRGILEKAGWATPLGTSKPNRALVDSCLNAIENKT